MASVRLGPTVLDISGVRAGDVNQINFAISRNGAPVNLTDYTISAHVRKAATDPAVAITATTQMLDPEAGTFWIAFDGDDVRTALGTAATFKGVWDLQLASSEAVVTTIAAGAFEAVMDVTRNGS